MGPALPGVRLWIDDGELCLDPLSAPTFFLGYLGEDVLRREDGGWEVSDRRDGGVWRTGDRVTQDEDGYLHFEGRADDVIISAGYRIGPFEVESALVSHPAVAEAAVVAAPDAERGSVVRAVVVLRAGHEASDALARDLQDHVKASDRALQVPADRGVRRRPAEDGERQGSPRAAARRFLSLRGRPGRAYAAPHEQ